MDNGWFKLKSQWITNNMLFADLGYRIILQICVFKVMFQWLWIAYFRHCIVNADIVVGVNQRPSYYNFNSFHLEPKWLEICGRQISGMKIIHTYFLFDYFKWITLLKISGIGWTLTWCFMYECVSACYAAIEKTCHNVTCSDSAQSNNLFSNTLSREYQVVRNRYSRLLFTSGDRLCTNWHGQKQSTNMTSQC